MSYVSGAIVYTSGNGNASQAYLNWILANIPGFNVISNTFDGYDRTILLQWQDCPHLIEIFQDNIGPTYFRIKNLAGTGDCVSAGNTIQNSGTGIAAIFSPSTLFIRWGSYNEHWIVAFLLSNLKWALYSPYTSKIVLPDSDSASYNFEVPNFALRTADNRIPLIPALIKDTINNYYLTDYPISVFGTTGLTSNTFYIDYLGIRYFFATGGILFRE